MHEVALDLLILLTGIWLVAVTLRPLGLPTVMGELIVGVLLGPAVFGLIEPSEAIQLLAEVGIFFLMFHAGVETQPVQFYDALKRSLGVAVVGAVVPFGVSFLVATLFGIGPVGATFVGLTMTATAVVITLKCLKDLGLADTRLARVIIASCVIDDFLTLVVFGLVVGVLSGGDFEPLLILITLAKVVAFFAVSIFLGRFVYPRLTLPFRSEGGKGFTFVLVLAFGAGLFAEAIGLHMILGAYVAGLFFEEKVAHPNLVRVVNDRAYGIAYSFLGPIFFISLGFSITFDISGRGIAFMMVLTTMVIIGQILSAGGMARRMGLPLREALTVGVGMCGRAEMAFILASLALAQGAIDQAVFTVLIFTAFVLNLFTTMGLKGCAVLLEGKVTRQANATRGVVQIDKFGAALVDDRAGRLPNSLADAEGHVVVHGYGPEVKPLVEELIRREIPATIIDEDEAQARRLLERGVNVVHASPATEGLDLRPLAKARAMVTNGADELSAMLAVGAREQGFRGPIVALIKDPHRQAAMQLAGATMAFTPTHVLAAVLASRASSRIGPRVTGVQPFSSLLEVVELRVHDKSSLAHSTLAKSRIRERTGALVVGQWLDDELHSPPAADESLLPGAILVAVGSQDSIRQLSEITRPIPLEGPIVLAGFGVVGQKLAEMLTDVGEQLCVIDEVEQPGVHVVGDVLDTTVLQKAAVADARVVILTRDSDSSNILAATVVRNFAPDVPILASAVQVENVQRIQQAGADFALSVGQVSGQLLAHHVLGETISTHARIKMVKIRTDQLAGRSPLKLGIRERTGCSVVAVERDGEIIMDFSSDLVLNDSDALYICGTHNAFDRYREQFETVRV